MIETRSEPNSWNPQGPPVRNDHLKPAALDGTVDAITSYLVHAKKECAAEPEYFSFNEPDCGAHVKFTPEEHRDFIARAGAKFAAAGLKTRLLLGDVCQPRGSETFVQATLDDPAAMKFVGAISFHSWGGATPAQYEAWNALATSHKLPLFCCEAGVDSGAWQGQRYRDPNYAVLEAAHYLDLFRYARPRTILYWEFTADYSLLEVESDGLKGRTEDSQRFALQRHWSRYIPSGSEFLTLTGEHPDVHASAFRNVTEKSTTYTLNLANTAWARAATIGGIPASVKSLRMIETSASGVLQKRADVEVHGGEVRVDLPKRSLVTLTTIEE
jgi:O-glycosyl hydrolase